MEIEMGQDGGVERDAGRRLNVVKAGYLLSRSGFKWSTALLQLLMMWRVEEYAQKPALVQARLVQHSSHRASPLGWLLLAVYACFDPELPNTAFHELLMLGREQSFDFDSALCNTRHIIFHAFFVRELSYILSA